MGGRVTKDQVEHDTFLNSQAQDRSRSVHIGSISLKMRHIQFVPYARLQSFLGNRGSAVQTNCPPYYAFTPNQLRTPRPPRTLRLIPRCPPSTSARPPSILSILGPSLTRLYPTLNPIMPTLQQRVLQKVMAPSCYMYTLPRRVTAPP